MQEKIIQTKTCKKCSASFDITDKDLEFYKKVSPKFDLPNQQQPSPSLSQMERDKWNDKFLIPTPTLCPDCRQQRRLAFRNERKLYKRKCDATGKDIISMYSPDKPYTVYSQDYWWSDKWDAMDYGRDFDFSKSFFEQFGELLREVPKINLSVEKQENTDYSNYAGNNKDSYLIFLGADNEDCYYCNGVWTSKKSMDSSYSTNLQKCYGVINSINLYNCYFSEVLENCSNCLFCFDIKNKKYHIFNKEVSVKEFEKIKESLSSYNILNKYLRTYLEFKSRCIKRNNYNLHSENVLGEYIIGSKNTFFSHDVVGLEDCKYSAWLFYSKNCYDIYDWGDKADNCYECHKIGDGASNIFFSAFCLSNVNNILYSYDCVNNSSNLFGCVGLKNKQYCILNKQYSKKEYNKLVPKIIEKMKQDGEWGEFFPASLSPFGYNETVAMEYFPVNPPIPNPFPQGEKGDKMFSFSLGGKDAGKADRGNYIFNRSIYESPFPKVQKIIPADKLPENIADIPDDILNWAIECEVSRKPFRVIKQELEFYRKHNLPIPKKHPDVRHEERMKLRNPRKLFDRKCDKCGKEIKSTYAPEREEIVYCQNCYEKEIY